MTILRILGWLVAVVSAVLVGLTSYAVGNEVRTPGPVPIFGYSLSGKAAGNLAYASFVAREEKARGSRVSGGERALAYQAFRKEPLSSPAVAILAQSMVKKGEGATRAALFNLASKLTRRNLLISSELIKSSAERQDTRSFFIWLSRSMSANDDVRKGYSLAMAEATARNDAVEALLPVLGSAPRWSDDYWQSVVTRPGSLANAAKLRMELTRKPWRQVGVAETDQKLILGLVNSRQFDIAEKLAGTLGLRQNGTGLIRNGDFASLPSFSPFDWELSTLGNLGSSISASDKNLSISAIGGAKGLAAQQLLRLLPGDYQLGWSLSGNLPADSTPLSIRISCAETGVEAMAPLVIPLATGKQRRSVVITGETCRWHWLSIIADMPDDAPGLDVYLDNVSVVSERASET